MSSLGIRINDSQNWIIVNGSIELANYLLSKIRLQLTTLLGSWLYDTTIGSQVPQLIQIRQNLTSEQIKKILSDAISPLESSGEINNVVITLTYVGLSRYDFTINGLDSTGEPITFNFTTKEL